MTTVTKTFHIMVRTVLQVRTMKPLSTAMEALLDVVTRTRPCDKGVQLSLKGLRDLRVICRYRDAAAHFLASFH